MGYRSQVVFKTTTEGYLLFKAFNASITNDDEKPLFGLDISKTKDGFFRIEHNDIKWYESFTDVQNFIKFMDKLDHTTVPYRFIRIGEDDDDIETRENWTDDMPEQLMDMGIERNVFDPDEYEDVEGDE